MIKSMTAFARQELKSSNGVLCWEVRTLNHRYLDLSFRLPEELRGMESSIRELAGSRLRRGKLEGHLRYQATGGAPAEFTLNEGLVARLLEMNGRIEDMMDNPARASSIDILRWPHVIQTRPADLAQLQKEALELLEATLQEIQATRAREGDVLKGLILQRCDNVREQVDAVRDQMPGILKNIGRKLRVRLEELEAKFEPARLEQELLYLAQKADIEEEIDRIGVHLEEVERILEQEGPAGRKLDFLMQELNREANTLGSKSVDAATTRASVEIKVAIEQMREQVQNVE